LTSTSSCASRTRCTAALTSLLQGAARRTGSES
jgi:hypothetical protein